MAECRRYIGSEFLDLRNARCREMLLAKRTFWEKATILNAEYYRPRDQALLGRYSRHYYDVAMLAQGPIPGEALADRDLLVHVERHKETFDPSAWARYDLARRGNIRVVPAENRTAALEKDYRDMAVIIFREPPTGRMMETLAAFEQEVNRQGGREW